MLNKIEEYNQSNNTQGQWKLPRPTTPSGNTHGRVSSGQCKSD